MKTKQNLAEYSANQLKLKNIKQDKEVYCVISIPGGERVSQWYSRAGDAKRKAEKMNACWMTEWIAIAYQLHDPEVIFE